MRICRDIMFENPACCLPEDTANLIAKRMATENIDAFLVVESYASQKLIGIITDNDIALKLVGGNRSVVVTQVRDIMTPNPFTCYPTDDIDSTLQQMSVQQIRRLPVMDKEGRVIGIIIQARSIRARITLRFDDNNNLYAVSTHETVDGWGDIAVKVNNMVKQVSSLKHLTMMLNGQESGIDFPAGSAPAM